LNSIESQCGSATDYFWRVRSIAALRRRFRSPPAGVVRLASGPAAALMAAPEEAAVAEPETERALTVAKPEAETAPAFTGRKVPLLSAIPKDTPRAHA
jgi:hypothetical protein